MTGRLSAVGGLQCGSLFHDIANLVLCYKSILTRIRDTRLQRKSRYIINTYRVLLRR